MIRTSSPPIRALMAVTLVAVAVSACDDPSSSPLSPDFSVVPDVTPGFEVYTQNLYLGGDTGPLFSLDFTDIPAVIAATNVFWADVVASDVPGRTAEIVDEIDRLRPHAVTLQEVLRFVVLDGTFTPTGGIDLLAAIEAHIAARGLPYTVEATQATTSSALPLAVDLSTGTISQWLGFTDRVVTLRRTDVDVVAVAGDTYAASLDLGVLEFKRGWTRVTFDFEGGTYHVVNTHLEVQPLAPIQAAQAAELRDGVLAGLDGVTILAGDLNSNAAAGPGDPTWTPTYQSLIDAGFVDVWYTAPNSGPGLTCCHPNSLTGDAPFSQRIDFILARGPAAPDDGMAQRHGAYRAEIVGEEAGDRTTGGLWPSDHAGLFGDIRLPARDR